MVNTIIIIYFLLVLALGIYSRMKIKNPTDFYIAGKKGGVFQVSGSLLATILGGSAILGTLELSQQNGWSAIWFLVCASLGLLFLVPMAKYVSRYGKFTLPGLLGHFYGRKALLISSLIITVAWVGIIAAQVIGSAKILNSIGIFDYKVAAMVSGFVFIAYTLLGGQKSILKTDFIQSTIIIFGLIFFFFSIKGSHLTFSPKEMTPNGLFHQGFNPLDLFILFLTYSTTFVVGPDIYSRIFCAKSEKTARKSVLFSAILLIPIAYIVTSLGISTQAVEAGKNEIGILLAGNQFLPLWGLGLLAAALLSAVMSSADTTLLTASMIGSNIIHPDLDTKKAYLTTKVIIIILGILSIGIALFVTSIIQMLLFALSFFSGAFIVPTISGLLGFKNKNGLLQYAMIIGGLVALTGKLISVYHHNLFGNLLIIVAFIVNGMILFFPLKKR